MKYYNFYKAKIATINTFLFFALIFPGSAIAQTKAHAPEGYGNASYDVAQRGVFMKRWLVAGPVNTGTGSTAPDEAAQQKAFNEDVLNTVSVTAGKPLTAIRIHQKDLQWKMVSSGEDGVVLDKIYGVKNYAYVYALAEIKAPAATSVILGLGSDDGVKVWLNSKLVHENWIGRAVSRDNDVIPLNLVKGSNQLLLKVQNMQGGWGFIARILDKAALSEQLSVAAASGNLDKINTLISSGANVNEKNESGITPLTAAKVAGRDEVVQLLLKKGAMQQAEPSPESLLDAFYAPLKNKEAPGIALLVAKNGKIIYEKGFGYADIKGKRLVTPATKFRIGSVTKQFTASAILKLQENHLLSVNDKLSKYIPDFPRGDEVTIHNLLTHTSGIHSYTSKPEFISRVTKTISEDSLIGWFKNDPYDFSPGENWMYDNSGYFLLGYIIEKVSGKPYAQYLKETFFDPLGMKNTGVHYAGIKLENEAYGYSSDNGKYPEAMNWDMSWAGGAGALYSTVEDLWRWTEALHSGKVISEAGLKSATTPVVLKNGEKASSNYGYGLAMNTYRGQDIIGHSGGLHGFITQLAYYPKQKMTIVMFSNSGNPEVNFDPNKIAEAVIWKEMDKQSSYAVSAVKPANLKQFTGRYDFGSIGVMQITTDADKLYAQLTGQAKYEIFPSAENEFFWKVVDAKIQFVKNETNEVTHGLFTQNGQQITVKKLKEDSIIKVDPAALDNYTGRYRLNSEIMVTVSKEADRLFAQPTGQPRLELFPVSETDFVVKELNARLSFIKGENDKANKIKLHMSGTDSELLRVE